MEQTKTTEQDFSSNAMRLTPRQWLVTLTLFVLVLSAFPKLWKHFETFDTPTDFRLAGTYRDDYWIFSGWTEQAADQYPILFMGDSVIWGAYVANEHTLPAHLNSIFDQQQIANLAIDGLHPVAMKGLLDHYGSAISGTKIILHFNPLWLSSKRQDLTAAEEFPINHPRLLPQWSPDIESYHENFEAKVGIVQQRYLPYVNMVNHLRLCHLNNRNFSRWVIDNPRKNPFAQIVTNMNVASQQGTDDSRDFRQRNLAPRDWQWVSMADSFQWKYFIKTVKILHKRGSDVFVMVGPVNPHMLTPESRIRLENLYSDTTAWLKDSGIVHFVVPDMEPALYADATHPTAAGYELIAERMLADEKVRNWINK